MTISRKDIMTAAWIIARRGATRFGGSARQYIAEALRQVWSGEADIFVAAQERLIRSAGPYTITHDGSQFLANGRAARWIDGAREVRRLSGKDLPAGKCGAVMIWATKNRADFITLTTNEYFKGKNNPEGKRLRAHYSRDHAARKFWDGMNENGDGYNPYR